MNGPFRITSLDDYPAIVIGTFRFRNAMKAKLEKKVLEGRGGWNIPSQCSIKRLEQMLLDHVKKGDPVDIANFCMFIWNRRNPYGMK